MKIFKKELMNINWDIDYKNMWNNRYRDIEFVYGKEPNQFFKESIIRFDAKAILLPADGEGRNGVFAATEGWKVTSFDFSEEGKIKALSLAKEKNISLNYLVGDLDTLKFEEETFDAIALIYAHFAADKKCLYHKKLNRSLKKGGIIIIEAFSKNHLEYNSINPLVGGPKNLDMLYSKDEIVNDFDNYEIILLEEVEINLNEGKYHNGKGSVIRFVGRKYYFFSFPAKFTSPANVSFPINNFS